MAKKIWLWVLLFSICMIMLCGCSKSQNAASNYKTITTSSAKQEDIETSSALDTQSNENATKPVNSNAIVKDTATYDCDIKADKAYFNGKVDIVVGDNLYATQINDWYSNFDEYAGKVVQIEGYYIGDFKPYDFIGRHGPTCPYCQGGYVCFEILTDEDMSQYRSGKDWIRVTGILRQGNDSAQGPFYYIEVMKTEKMDKVGKETVTN